VEEIIDRRNRHQVRLILPAIDLNSATGSRALQDAIEENGMFLRMNAGDESGVIRPGDGRIRNPHSFGGGAFGGQLSQKSKRCFRIGEIISRAAVDRNQNNVIIGRKRMMESPCDEQKNRQSPPAAEKGRMHEREC
jgi:hypothetical protein